MKKPLRILYLIDSLATGGAERMAVNIANLMAEDHQVHLVVTRKEGPFKADISPKVHYDFLNKRSTADWRAYWKLFRYIQKNKIRIIHAHSTSVFMALMIKWRLPWIKIVWHDHSGASMQQHSGFSLLRLMASRINYLVSVNKKQLDEAFKHLPIRKGEVLINFASVKNPGVDRKKHLVIVANWRPEKNVLLAVKAFEKIHKHFPEWHFDLVGQPSDPVTSEEIRRFIRKKGLEKAVSAHHEVNDVGAFLFGAQIGVLSSHWEGLPVALLEYGLAELAVAATGVGGVGQVIRNEETGLLVPPDDAGALAGAIQRLIKDEVLRKRLAGNLHREVQNHYSAAAYKAQLEKIYHEVLK